jgi:glycosyltransferase involved in cell wall biosynthesis
MTKISIITPSYNQSRYIKNTIESVISQKVNFEYIIMDNCSNDGTLEIIKNYNNKLFLIAENDNGQADALANGFSLASGEIFCWLNSDDIFLPNSLKDVISHFDQGLEFIYGNVFIIDSDNNIVRKRVSTQISLDDLYYGNYCIPQEATFFSKDLYMKCGGIDPSFKYAMDYDLWLRMAQHCLPKKVDQYFACFRFHENQKSRNISAYRDEVQRSKFAQKSFQNSFYKHIFFRMAITLRLIHLNLVESGGIKTVFDIYKKVIGRLP